MRCADKTHTHHIQPQTTTPPTVIELFQSQGCSSCPPTNALILSLLAREDPNLLILSYDVTYWDHLGWEDTFGQPAWNDRQWEYARSMGMSRVYTPQVIVNGVAEGVGNNMASLEAVIEKGQRGSQINTMVEMELVHGGLLVKGELRLGTPKARILLVRYDPKMLQVEIPRGENGGRVLPHQNTVRGIEVLGEWDGGARVYAMEHEEAGAGAEEGLWRVLLVQEGLGGRIIGAARV
jgi:hypothetical protein